MAAEMLGLKSLVGLAKIPFKAAHGRWLKRKQLNDAVNAAAARAGNEVPARRNEFCRPHFVKRNLLPLARRYAKIVDRELLGQDVADRFLMRFPTASADPEILRRSRAEARELGNIFVRVLRARLLEASEWRATVAAQVSLQTLEGVRRLVPDLPGFDWSRAASGSKQRILEALASPEESMATFGQVVNLRDPSLTLKVGRATLLDAIKAALAAPNNEPVLVEGEEGVGKTWAAIEAATEAVGPGDLLLVVPCRAIPPGGLEELILSALQDHLHDGTEEGWREWLRAEFPPFDAELGDPRRLLLVLDGVNQNQLINWRVLLADSRGSRWRDRVRLLLTARPRHAREVSAILEGLGLSPARVPVAGYDDVELAEALAAVGRADLLQRTSSPSLERLLRTPRYFQIAAKLWESVNDLEEVTPNRLILEDLRLAYGRHSSELDQAAWATFLAELGQKTIAEGQRQFSPSDLKSALGSTTLNPTQVEAALQEIASGRLFTEQGLGKFALADHLAPFAIGMAIVARFVEAPPASLDDVLNRLDQLLPELGADARSEALRAGTVISLYWPLEVGGVLRAGLLAAWLTSQNPTANDDTESAAYAFLDPVAFVDAYEGIASGSSPDHRALWVIAHGLEQVANQPLVRDTVLSRAVRWAGYVGLREAFLGGDEAAERSARHRRLETTLGAVPPPGALSILGCDLTFVVGWDAKFLLEFASKFLSTESRAVHIDVFRTAPSYQPMSFD